MSLTPIRSWYWWPLTLVAILLTAAGAVAYHRACYTHGLEGAKPWFGDWGPLYAQLTGERRGEPRQWWPMLVAGFTVAAWLGVLIWRRRWTHWLLLPAFVVVVIVNVSVARIDGPHALIDPFTRTPLEYYGDVQRVGDEPLQFIADYPQLIAPGFWSRGRKLSGHARTHPPGGVIVLWAAGHWIDPSIETAAWTAILLSALSVIPALLWLRELLDEEATALAAGLYVAVPGLVMFSATCMDGVFMLPTMTALWLGERAVRGKLWTRVSFGLLAGVAFAAAFFMTFTASAVGVFFLCRLVFELLRRKWDDAGRLAATGGLALVAFVVSELLLAWATGYDLIANIRASIAADAQYVGTGTETWTRYFDVSTANLIAFLMAAGVALVAAASFGLWRNAKVAAYVLGIFVLGFSTLYTLETERVWMAFYVIVTAAAAVWIASLPNHRQRAVGLIAITVLVLSQTLWFEWVAYTHW